MEKHEKAIVLGLVFVLIVATAVVFARRQRARVYAAWNALAVRLGGAFVPASGSWWRRQSGRVEATIGEVVVTLDHYTVSHGKSSTTYSRTRVETPCRHRLTVYRESVFSGIGKVFGMQDLLVGDSAYDDRFVIKSDDEAWARKALNKVLRRAHLDAPKLKLEVKDGRVETVQVGFDNDVDSLERRMRLTAALATAVRTRA